VIDSEKNVDLANVGSYIALVTGIVLLFTVNLFVGLLVLVALPAMLD